MLLSQLNEVYRNNLIYNYANDSVDGFQDSMHAKDRLYLLVLIYINLFLTVIQAIIAVKVLQGMGTLYFKRFYSWLDLIILIVNISLFGQFTRIIGVDHTEDWREYKELTMAVRYTIVIGILVYFLKLLYFMSLVEKISPLIDCIFKCVYDIGWFTIILIIMSFAFGCAFWLLG